MKACAFTCVGEFRIRRLRIATDPFRNFRNSHANPFRNPITRTKNLSSQKIDVAKKKKRHYTPPSGQPAPRFPACQFAPRNPRGAVGSNPSAWKILSRPCPLCVSRTPRQTSGLPAGTEPSFESRVILASINSKTLPHLRSTKKTVYTLNINLIRTPPAFIRTSTDECGNPIP